MTERVRPRHPRLAPLDPSSLDEETKRHVPPGALNIFRTLAHHPKLLKRWLVFGAHVLGKSTFPTRERELAILRIGWLCQAEYEFGQHTVMGRNEGVTDAEILALTKPLDDHAWSDVDRAVLDATDELHADQCITDDTWARLQATWNEQQLIDLVFTVGQYTMVSMALNTLGVELDDGIPGFPEG